MNGKFFFSLQQSAWELPGHGAWHQAHRNTNGRLANAGKHESGVQRLKVAQIFTTHSAIRAKYLLHCTVSHLPSSSASFFSMGSPCAVAATSCTLQLGQNNTLTQKKGEKLDRNNPNTRWACTVLQWGKMSQLESLSNQFVGFLALSTLCLFTQLNYDQWLIWWSTFYSIQTLFFVYIRNYLQMTCPQDVLIFSVTALPPIS